MQIYFCLVGSFDRLTIYRLALVFYPFQYLIDCDDF
jgi:hypothetical protein